MNKATRQMKRGSALLTVLLVIFGASAIVGTVAGASLHRTLMARRLSNRVRAWAIAEAGAADAFSVLQLDFNSKTNADAFPRITYGLGYYDVGVQPVGDNLAVISSTGVCGLATAVVIVDAKHTSVSTPGWDESAFEYAMLSGGNNTFRGCGNISGTNGGARMHANGVMDIRGNAKTDINITSTTKIKIGNNITVDGDVTAPSLQYKSSKVTITGTPQKAAVVPVEIPDIDLTPYYNWALKNGEVHNGFALSGGTYDAKGGVIWVNGDVQLSSHTVVNGSIIATGNIKIAGQADVNASEYGFSVATRDGAIENQSTGTIKGLMYARTGGYKHTANGKVEGAIIVKGDIDKGGSSDVLLYSKIIPTYPGDPTGDDLVGVSAWQQ